MAETNGANGTPTLEENAFPALEPVTPEKPVEGVAASTNDDNETPEAPKELTAAEKLMQQHLAAEEPVEAEAKSKEPQAPAEAIIVPQKASAKQKSANASAHDLDLSSVEAFPTLGAPTKVAPVAMNWGAKMAAPPVNSSSGTPEFGVRAPAASFAGNAGQQTVELTPAQKRPISELRKPVNEIVKDIMKKTSTKIDLAKTSTGVSVFVVKGNEASRQRARREIYKELSLKASKTIQVPAVVRPHIIGKGGSRIQELERETLTHIRVPQQNSSEAQAPVGDYDDEIMIDVVVEGDEFGVASAIERIREIVGERTIVTTTRISDIPGELYPFIQGPNRKNLAEYETKVERVSVPDYFFSASSQPFSPPSGPIVITGEKSAVQEVRAAIEKRAEELKAQNYGHILVPIPAAKHRFFTDNDGYRINEVLEETGCTVIFPSSGKANSAIVYGPADQIGNCYTKTNAISQAYQYLGLDVCKAYPNAPGGAKLHARDITRYYIQRGEFESLEYELGVEIAPPSIEELYNPTTSCIIEIMTQSKEGLEAARSKIQAIYLQAKPFMVARLDVEPLHHRHIVKKDTLLEGLPVKILFPEDLDEPELVLVYEGGSTEPEEIGAILEKVKEEILAFSGEQVSIISKTINIPKENHAKIRGERDTTLNALNPSSVLVQFGIPKARPGKPTPTGDENTITVRGPQSNVEATIKNINNFLASENPEAIITESFEYPAQFSGNLIGVRGANINKLRDDLGVEINLKEGKGEIKGVRVAVDAARKKLTTQIKELEDKATVRLVIPQEFHSTIIGQKGESVRRLEARYDVRINFPRSSKADYTEEYDTWNKQQGPNEVVIKGGKKGVEEARVEIIALLKYEEAKSHTVEIPIAAKAVEFMFRNSAKEIKQLREESAARIDIPQRPEEGSEEQMVIKIRGTVEEVNEAEAILSKIVKDAEQTTVRKINVDKKYHRSLIGQGGKTLREIVVGAGGPDDRAALARMVRFPNQDSEGDEITVQGNATVVDKIIQAIEKIVTEKENQISINVEVAPEKHRKLIGREGSIRKELEAKFKVTIDIPNRNRPGQTVSSDIKITGAEEDVEKAKEHILELVKDPEGETIMVPRYLHHSISDIIRELYKRYRVNVNHNNEPRPPKPEDKRPQSNADLPLITDEVDSVPKYNWDVQENIHEIDNDEYPWVLSGSPENIAKAKADIESALEVAKKQTWIGYLDLPDPRKYRFVVGPGGAQIEKIRRETSCRINVPNKQQGSTAPPEGPIVIHGSKDDIEKAKGIILELINNDGSGGKGGDSDGDRRRQN